MLDVYRELCWINAGQRIAFAVLVDFLTLPRDMANIIDFLPTVTTLAVR